MTTTLEALENQVNQLANQVGILRQELADAREKTEQLDDWCGGLHQAMVEALAPLLKENPEAARIVAATWDNAQQQFDRALKNNDRPDLHEPRKMLANQIRRLGGFGKG